MPIKEQSQPLVSIITLCYNQSKYLEETLDSILALSYKNWELVITDDYSSDNSVEKISSWIERTGTKCQFIAHEQNKGICKTLNEALSHCKGKYVQIIACDDVMMPEKLNKQVAILENSSEKVAGVYSDAIRINENGGYLSQSDIEKKLGHALLNKELNVYQDLLVHTNFITACSILLKKSVYEKVGYYDEELSYEDLDMWLRITYDMNLIFSDYVSVKYRVHEKNTSGILYKKFKFLDSTYKIFKKQYRKKKADKSLVKKQLHMVINEMYKASPAKSRKYIIDYNLLTLKPKFIKYFIRSFSKTV